MKAKKKKELKTITIDGETVEVATINGKNFCGLYISPRGFANEYSIYVAEVDNSAQVAGLGSLRSRDGRNGTRAHFIDRREIAKHFYGAKGWGQTVTEGEYGMQPNAVQAY